MSLTTPQRVGVPHPCNVEVADQRDRVAGEPTNLVDKKVLGTLAVGECDRGGSQGAVTEFTQVQEPVIGMRAEPGAVLTS